jgi:hypothetical protein
MQLGWSIHPRLAANHTCPKSGFLPTLAFINSKVARVADVDCSSVYGISDEKFPESLVEGTFHFNELWSWKQPTFGS